ncbi:N-acetylmuramoyl-L-alanine amidase family protein [Mucilaginibacter limnophilus]|uniref:N-acetylmuramoyl-L-alanine amidase family protein n=1 Tax=Mucilaginibacter limnophilus TaxID=1932778 RepID=UPI0013E32CC5|nr:N-acetylmuramoyl-L-alanine amidase [Mucilaginibacter limnophilus]
MPDSSQTPGFKVKTVIVDAGHGGFRAGASGAYSVEKNVTLQIAFKLQKAIEKELNDVKVVMTRTTDEDILWQKRATIANENKGDLFVSIHCNSLADRVTTVKGKRVRVPNRSGKGVLLLVYGFHRTKEEEKAIKETRFEDDDEMNAAFDPNDPAALILLNEYKRKYRKQSIRFANLLSDEFSNDGRRIEGIREQGVLVLCRSAMPAVLVETGYINNPDEEEYLNSEAGQNEIVASIVKAIRNFKKEVEN